MLWCHMPAWLGDSILLAFLFLKKVPQLEKACGATRNKDVDCFLVYISVHN